MDIYGIKCYASCASTFLYIFEIYQVCCIVGLTVSSAVTVTVTVSESRSRGPTGGHGTPPGRGTHRRRHRDAVPGPVPVSLRGLPVRLLPARAPGPGLL
jgi:hypothetical protein